MTKYNMSRQRFVPLIIVMIIFALGFSVPALATLEAVAMVVAVRGMVLAEDQAGQVRKLKIKSPLFREDTIKTGKSGRIQMLFTDNSIISLARKAEMIIADYKWDAVGKSGVLMTKVKEGAFRVMGGAITKFSPKQFTTETPMATIGVRGSMYAGLVTGTSLSVVFQGGKGIDVINAAGSVAITTPGFGTHVLAFNQPPLDPEKFSVAEMTAINNALNGPPVPEDKLQSGEDDEAAGEPVDGTGSVLEEPTGEPPPGDETMLPLADTSSSLLASAPLPASITYYDPATDPASAPLDPTDSITAPVDPTVPSDTTIPVDSTVPSDTTVPVDTTIPTVTLPIEGVSGYNGIFSGVDSISGDTIQGDVSLEINWYSGKVFGIMNETTLVSVGSRAFFMGTMNGTSIINIRVFGSDGGDPNNPFDYVSALDGTGAGSILGTQYDSIEFSAVGNDYGLAQPGNIVEGSWSIDAVGVIKLPALDPAHTVSPKGTSVWNGFSVAISENVNVIDVERKIFMNKSPDSVNDHFLLNINRDSGTISGDIKATQVDRVNGGGLNLTIGGTYGSAYVLDDFFGAIIGCSGDCINDDTGSVVPNVTINQHGNYLVAENPQKQFSPYVTWGYWEISHEEPDGPDFDTAPDMYHTHMPYSMWIAGERTPATYVSNLLNNTTFVGNYSGMANGFLIDSGGVKALSNGHVDLAVDFASAKMASAVTGALSFDEVILKIDSAASMLTSGGFQAVISNAGVLAGSSVNGAFYGPGVNAVGGNFQADFSTEKYIGIFGGNLINGPAP